MHCKWVFFLLIAFYEIFDGMIVYRRQAPLAQYIILTDWTRPLSLRVLFSFSSTHTCARTTLINQSVPSIHSFSRGSVWFSLFNYFFFLPFPHCCLSKQTSRCTRGTDRLLHIRIESYPPVLWITTSACYPLF